MFKFRSVITRTISSTRPFPWLRRYSRDLSDEADMTYMVRKFLVSSLGFSEEEAFNIYKLFSPFRLTQQPDSFTGFYTWWDFLHHDFIRDLRSRGFTLTQIKTMVLKSPKVLSYNENFDLLSKMSAFYDMGFSRSDVPHILSEYPAVFESTLNDDIVTTIALLKTVLRVEVEGDGWNEVLMTMVNKWPKFLNTEHELCRVVPFLDDYGLTPSQFRTFALWKTRYLLLGTDVLDRVRVRLFVKAENLDRINSPMFLYGIIAMCTVNEVKLELKMGVYRRYGFTDKDLLKVVRRNPHALMISLTKLRKCLEFFINVVGFCASEVAEVPYVLTFSYVRRLCPRYDVWKCLKEKANINQSFVSCLTMNDAQFFEKYVVPLKDECPDLYHDSVKRLGPLLRLPSRDDH